MRISDWSADVCSSDLGLALEDLPGPFRRGRGSDGRDTGTVVSPARDRQAVSGDGPDGPAAAAAPPRALSEVIADPAALPDAMVIADERRAGKECVSKFSSRWSPEHSKNTQKAN